MMVKSRDYVFVLWGDRFDETVATIFVTELREAGLLVKVVGLTSRHISGAHGLTLLPDLTLDQALPLADQAVCLIIPATSQWGKRLNNDPRVHKFIKQASSSQTKFVVGLWNETIQSGLDIPEAVRKNVIVYPQPENLVQFARELAKQLSKRAIT